MNLPAVPMIRLVRNTVYLLACCLLFNQGNSIAQQLNFRKVNSGTRSQIRSIEEGADGNLFMQTEVIAVMISGEWKRIESKIQEKVDVFCPTNSDDIWFTVNQVTNTSRLYRLNKSKLGVISAPFPNDISAMKYIGEDSILIAGPSDLAIYHADRFRILPSVPTRHLIVKIIRVRHGAFYILTLPGELFYYHDNTCRKIATSGPVTDLCMDPSGRCFFLAGTDLNVIQDPGPFLIMKNPEFRKVRAMTALHDGSLVMVGMNGLILSYDQQNLTHFPPSCSENLTGILKTRSGDLWAYGDNGRVLYNGKRSFIPAKQSSQGFAMHKLIDYSFNIDDEYGVALADFNLDGLTDIYATRIFEQNRLYINHIEASDQFIARSAFKNEAIKRNAAGAINPMEGLIQGELKMGVTVADVDNDHDQDIYLCYLNCNNKLLLNTGNGHFRNVSGQQMRACLNMYRSNAASFSDADLDGDLDLFVTSEEGSNRFYENDGTGHFKDITADAGLMSLGGGMCSAFSDVDQDGLPDLCVTFWYPGNKLYLNRSSAGRIRFVDASAKSGLFGAPPAKSNAVIFADINNDGASDLFITNRNNRNRLYLNNGKGFFTDVTGQYFKPENSLSNGAVFADFDLDGYLDLYVTNVGGNKFFRNAGGMKFVDATAETGAELTGYCTGSAVGDIDNDGDPDMYVANYINGNSVLLMNINESKTFVKVLLHGVCSNHDAIGAKVWIYFKGTGGLNGKLAGYRELAAGNGYGSTSAKEVIFGVDRQSIYQLQVRFPSSPNRITIDHVVAGQTIEINELTGWAALKSEIKGRLIRFFTNPENQPEIGKYFIITLLLTLYNLIHKKSSREVKLFSLTSTALIFATFIMVNRIYLFQWPEISYLIAPLMVAGLLTMVHLYISRRLLKKLLEKEKRELREKLSRDLHDDLASSLGSISLYSETLSSMTRNAAPEMNRLTHKIASLSHSVLQSVADIIWMTSPRNDSLQSLIDKSGQYMNEILTDNGILFSPVIYLPEQPVILKEGIRNDAFLILKEGLNNILRHSGAKEVIFSVNCITHLCTISLKDDGCGITMNNTSSGPSRGYGMENMKRRAADSGIDLNIHSMEQCGTVIILKIPI